jgi:hypothetical protein
MNIESSKSRCKPLPLLVFVIRRNGGQFAIGYGADFPRIEHP